MSIGRAEPERGSQLPLQDVRDDDALAGGEIVGPRSVLPGHLPAVEAVDLGHQQGLGAGK